MIEAVIDGISRGNNLGGTMRGINSLKLVLVYEGAVEISPELEEWLRYWWVDSLKKICQIDWFEVEGGNCFGHQRRLQQRP